MKRNSASSRPKVATEPGTCILCDEFYGTGDSIRWRRFAVHDICHAAGAFMTLPAAESIETIRKRALATLESAIEDLASVNGVTDDVSAQFAKYEKIRDLGMRPGTDAEGRTAMVMALKRAIDMVFVE